MQKQKGTSTDKKGDRNIVEALNNTSAVAQEHGNYQPESNDDCSLAEDPNYLSEQLITYIGNKRALLGQIGKAVMYVKKRTGKQHLRVFDAFSGSRRRFAFSESARIAYCQQRF